MKAIVLVTATVAGALFVAAGALGQPQSDGQQKCLLKINTEGAKVHRAQGKENNRCVKAFGAETLPVGPTAGEDCLTTDPKGKVQKFKDKVIARETSTCQGGNAPSFSFTGSATVNSAAQDTELGLMHDIYGNPVDNGLKICDTFPAECTCQEATQSRLEKLFKTMDQVWVKCKQYALAIDQDPFPSGAASPAELQQCIDNPLVSRSVKADTQGKIANRRAEVGEKILARCPTGKIDDSFPNCGLNDLSTAAEAADCLVDLVECRFCQMVNTMDALSVDCGMFAGTTCPVTP
jgi:hypothetical protein